MAGLIDTGGGAAPSRPHSWRPLVMACSLALCTSGTAAWSANRPAQIPPAVPKAETPPVPDRSKTGTAGPPKLIADATLLLRPVEGGAGAADPCDALRAEARGSAWCAQLRFDLQTPQRDAPATLRLGLDPATQVRAGGQPITSAITYQLSGQGCGTTPAGTSLIVTTQPGSAPCPVTLTVLSDAPGEYRTSLRVRDATGALDQSSTLTFKARSSWRAMLSWLALGGLIGLLLSYVRSLFQPRAARFGAALREAQRYEAAAELARRSRLVPPAQSRLLDAEVAAWLGDARAGRSIDPPAGAVALPARIDALRSWAALAQRATALEAARLAALRPRLESALFDVLAGAVPAAGLQLLQMELDQALRDQQTGAAETVEAQAAAREASAVVPTPDFGHIAFANVRTLAQLDRRAFIASLIETALTFLLFALAALIAIWVNDDAWGTSADILNAILIGAGAFLGAAAIRGIQEGVRL